MPKVAASTRSCREQRARCMDTEVQRSGREKSRRIDLGLEILAISITEGEVTLPLTIEQIAFFTGCTPNAVKLIEKKALAKIRTALRHRELMAELGLVSLK